MGSSSILVLEIFTLFSVPDPLEALYSIQSLVDGQQHMTKAKTFKETQLEMITFFLFVLFLFYSYLPLFLKAASTSS